MKRCKFLALFALTMVTLFALGCKREDKATGPSPILPEGGTTLFFANCAPFAQRIGLQDWATLVADVDSACNGTVLFTQGQQAQWSSGGFTLPAGSYTEGYHLAFERDQSEAQTPAVFRVDFQGAAGQFTDYDTIPSGTAGDALRKVFENAHTGTVGASDSLRPVTIILTDVSGIATLQLSRTADGSYLKVGVDMSALCQFRIIKDPHHGWSYDTLAAFDVGYESPNGGVSDSVFLDFTHGATMLANHRIQLGDKHGVAYLASASGACRDTAAFWSLASTQAYNMTSLGSTFAPGNLISDGSSVWFWDVQSVSPDSGYCGYFRVGLDSIRGAPLAYHRLYQCTGDYSVEFDGTTHHVWLIERGGPADTAWGYTTHGDLDSVVVAAPLPPGRLHNGYWLRETGHDLLRRTVVTAPFIGGGVFPAQTFPAEITEGFDGGAGFGYPSAGLSTEWTINVFDPLGHWIAQYPITMQDPSTEFIQSVTVLNSDHLITFAIQFQLFPFATEFQEVKVLTPLSSRFLMSSLAFYNP